MIQSLTPEALAHLTDRHHADPDVRAVCREVLHLREQRDHLQTRCTALALAERAARGVLSLRWQRLGDHTLPLPSKAHADDAGLDLAVIVEPSLRAPSVGFHFAELVDHGGSVEWTLPRITVYPGALVNFDLGFAVEIPPGWYGQLAVRSSVGKARWFLASSGVIDSSYRGGLRLPLLYLGEEPFTVEHGQRMAQMLLVPVPRVDCVEVSELSPTVRGAGGFGSTGR